MFCGNVMVGLVEIVIGVVLDLKHDPKGEKKLFVIQICLGAVSIFTLFWRSKLVKKRLSNNLCEKYSTIEEEATH